VNARCVALECRRISPDAPLSPSLPSGRRDLHCGRTGRCASEGGFPQLQIEESVARQNVVRRVARGARRYGIFLKGTHSHTRRGSSRYQAKYRRFFPDTSKKEGQFFYFCHFFATPEHPHVPSSNVVNRSLDIRNWRLSHRCRYPPHAPLSGRRRTPAPLRPYDTSFPPPKRLLSFSVRNDIGWF
jgi:hypothetical protein